MCCFFQAEDGIRDLTVTGVQTCALPICLFDQTIQEIESGTVDKQGNLTLMLRGDSSAFMVARMNPEPYILFYERSEEHTSELESQSNLVCRLLLEKKKPEPRRVERVYTR